MSGHSGGAEFGFDTESEIDPIHLRQTYLDQLVEGNDLIEEYLLKAELVIQKVKELNQAILDLPKAEQEELTRKVDEVNRLESLLYKETIQKVEYYKFLYQKLFTDDHPRPELKLEKGETVHVNEPNDHNPRDPAYLLDRKIFVSEEIIKLSIQEMEIFRKRFWVQDEIHQIRELILKKGKPERDDVYDYA